MPNRSRLAAILAVPMLVTGLAGGLGAQTDPKATEVWEPVPRVITPGNGSAAPSDAIVLFNGTDLSQWVRDPDGTAPRWKVEDGAFLSASGSGGVRTKQAFGDCQLHIEWRTPAVVSGEGQGRGNSGVFLMERYEVQVLDSYDNRTYSNGQAASVYKQAIPLVNASRRPGEWQSYDIVFRAPRRDAAGNVTTPAYVTVFHNGVLVQDHVALKGNTVYTGQPFYEKHGDKEPLMLQDHGNPVAFRNVWIREL
ncbi:MAG: DUF1080 domain-containing protein [Gemmatimonadaceae bacterium]|nr:DUF1080 domain-containing protein [Gemmatimonadaceae bacterium]